MKGDYNNEKNIKDIFYNNDITSISANYNSMWR